MQMHTPEKMFIGRKEEISVFNNFLRDSDSSKNILNYHGLPGIGKSTLLKHLCNLHSQNQETLLFKFDLDNYDFNNLSSALLQIKYDLELEHGISFYRFDLAYLIYLQKLSPGYIPNQKIDRYSFFNTDSFIWELIEEFNTPKKVFNIASLILNKYDELKAGMSPLSLKAREISLDLSEKKPLEIEQLLFSYLIKDLSNSNFNQFIFFVDSVVVNSNSFNTNWYKKFSLNQWLIDLLKHPSEIQWVIFSNEKIKLDKESNLTYMQLDKLSSDEINSFLIKKGISNNKLIKEISDLSLGIPFLLNLILEEIVKFDSNSIKALSSLNLRVSKEITNKIFNTLSINEQETLKILALANVWDFKIFVYLMRELNTGFPVTKFPDLLESSYVNEVSKEKDNWTLHSIVRSDLGEQLNNYHFGKYFKLVHHLIRIYYQNSLNEFPKNKKNIDTIFALRECVFHAMHEEIDESFIKWYCDITKQIMTSLSKALIIQELNSSLVKSLNNLELIANINFLSAEIYEYHGSYMEAIKSYDCALENTDSTSLEIESLFRKAKILKHISKYDSSRSLFYQVIKKIDLQLENSNHYEKIAISYQTIGKIEEMHLDRTHAIYFYQKALEYCIKGLVVFPTSNQLQIVKASTFEKLGESYGHLEDLDEQVAFYQKAHEIYNSILPTLKGHDLLTASEDFGLLNKRLAEIATDDETKKYLFKKAISYYDFVLEDSPFQIDCLEKKGHALTDYMILLIQNSALDDIHSIFKEACSVFEQVIQLTSYRSSANNRLASLHVHYAKYFFNENNLEKAHYYANISLDKFALVQTNTPEYAHYNSSLSSALEFIENLNAKI